MRSYFFAIAFLLIALFVGLGLVRPVFFHAFWVLGPILLVGFTDALQTRHTIRRNFPVIGWGRYLLEEIRPEIYQYFIESDMDGRPFSREQRSVIYQRAKQVLDTVPFGTQHDVYENGYEWIEHSLTARPAAEEVPRIAIGEGRCSQVYFSALLNISAMSFGSMSRPAIEALNRGAKQGGFAHNTGEGGISPYHRQGGDLIWQLGTGYFGARTADGGFDPDRFAERAADAQVKLIEVKLSQGAKPGHGGILPAAKVTPEIAEIRGVPLGKDVISPPGHRAFSTPKELIAFVAKLRELSGGKPVGIKLCVGRKHEFLAIGKAMVELGDGPDYIAIDGAEGGTGAAPLEFTNRVGTPLTDSLVFVQNALVGLGIRDRVKLIAAGRILTGFDMLRALSLGADLCYSARGMMIALGCIQARRCNSNFCPAGVATQDPGLSAGLVVPSKADRVAAYQHATVESLLELLGAAGLEHPSQLCPSHVVRRVSHGEIRHYGELYRWLAPGQLFDGDVPTTWAHWMAASSAESFQPVTTEDWSVPQAG